VEPRAILVGRRPTKHLANDRGEPETEQPLSMGTPEERQHCRIRYAALAVTTIIVGLVVHRVGLGLNPAVRDMLGDALWAMMIFYGLGIGFPGARGWSLAASALVICFGVEASQLYHSPWLDVVRGTLPGHLILGSGFEARDFLSYSLGVAAAAWLERARKVTHSS
jgi:hypothetical protein